MVGNCFIIKAIHIVNTDEIRVGNAIVMSCMVTVALCALLAMSGCRKSDPDARPPASVPTRVVSCSPSLTEIAFALGAGDKVVAVSDHCDFPPAAEKLPRVGPFLSPRVESILGARPDLVLLHDVHGDLDRTLAQAGVRTLRAGIHSIEDIHAAVRSVGRALRREPDAEALLARIARELREVRPAPSRRVLVIVGRDPGTLRNLFAAGPNTYLDELLTRAGADNILHDSPTSYPRVSTETIVARAPEVIIEALHPGADPERALADWQQLSSVPAVRDGRVHVVSDRLFVTPGPRLAQTLRTLADLVGR